MNFAHSLHIVFVIGKYKEAPKGDFFWWGGRVDWATLEYISGGGGDFSRDRYIL